MKYCSINGKSLTNLNINDRGLAYGDGLFTTAKIVDGRIELLTHHLNRLEDGCKKLSISLPNLSIQDALAKQLTKVAANYPLGILKVMITSGSGGRGYSRIGLNEDATNTIVMVFDYPQQYDALAKTGITLGVSKQKIGINPMLAGIKHLNRLEQVLIRHELDERHEDDLIVRNASEQVVEASCANLFYWIEGELYTPDVSVSGVDGLMRQFIMRNYHKLYNKDVKVTKTTLTQLKRASTMFTCNSVTGIMPVRSFNDTLLNLKAAYSLREQIQLLMQEQNA